MISCQDKLWRYTCRRSSATQNIDCELIKEGYDGRKRIWRSLARMSSTKSPSVPPQKFQDFRSAYFLDLDKIEICSYPELHWVRNKTYCLWHSHLWWNYKVSDYFANNFSVCFLFFYRFNVDSNFIGPLHKEYDSNQ